MSLPDIAHVAGTWGELVALSPMLSMFLNSEIEIDNDIPEYDGSAGIIGTVLALILVGVGSVKKIYETNEDVDNEIRRKRKSGDDVGSDVDRRQCVRKLLCSIGRRSRGYDVTVMEMFRNKPISKYGEAVLLGLTSRSSNPCSRHFVRCYYNESQLKSAFRYLINAIRKLHKNHVVKS